MAQAFVQNTNQGVGSVSVAAVATFTNTPAAGNLLLASCGNTTNTVAPVVSDSDGKWTLINFINTTVAGQCLGLYARIAAAVQPKAITTDNIGNKNLLNIYEISGNQNNAILALDNGQSGADNTAVLTSNGNGAPTITTHNAACLVFLQILSTASFATLSPTATAPSGATTPGMEQINTSIMDAAFIETGTLTFAPYFSWITTTRKFQQLTTSIYPSGAIATPSGFFLLD